jgi:predicted transposase YbfD/YdcC
LDPSDPLVSHSDETGGPGSVSESEREKWRKKLAAQARALSVLTEQLKAAHQRSNEIENKWKEERDLNVRMWEKVISVQRHIRQISRPLTTELALQGRL